MHTHINSRTLLHTHHIQGQKHTSTCESSHNDTCLEHSWHSTHTTYTTDTHTDPSVHLCLTARLLNKCAEGVTLLLTALASCQSLILHDQAWVSIAMATATPLLPREQLAHGGRLALKQIYWQRERERTLKLRAKGKHLYLQMTTFVSPSVAKRSYCTQVKGFNKIDM